MGYLPAMRSSALIAIESGPEIELGNVLIRAIKRNIERHQYSKFKGWVFKVESFWTLVRLMRLMWIKLYF